MREIRPLPGRHDDAVDRAERARLRVCPSTIKPLAVALDALGRKADHELAAGRFRPARFRSLPSLPRAGSWSAAPPPKTRVEIGAAHRPDELRRRIAVGEPGEIEQRVRRRMPAADHQHAPARIGRALAAEHVGNAVGDAVGVRPPRRSPAFRRRRAGSGCAQVPEASITARARSMRGAAGAFDRRARTDGRRGRGSTTLSMPWRDTRAHARAGFDHAAQLRRLRQRLR